MVGRTEFLSTGQGRRNENRGARLHSRAGKKTQSFESRHAEGESRCNTSGETVSRRFGHERIRYAVAVIAEILAPVPGETAAACKIGVQDYSTDVAPSQILGGQGAALHLEQKIKFIVIGSSGIAEPEGLASSSGNQIAAQQQIRAAAGKIDVEAVVN